MRKSVRSRIKITKTGKILRRAMGQSHQKAKKTTRQKRRKLRARPVHAVDAKQIIKNL